MRSFISQRRTPPRQIPWPECGPVGGECQAGGFGLFHAQRADPVAAGRLPEGNGPAAQVGVGGEDLAVGRDGDVAGPVVVHPELLAGGRVPAAERMVVHCGEETLAPGSEGQAVGIAGQFGQEPVVAGVQVPEADDALFFEDRGGEQGAVRGESDLARADVEEEQAFLSVGTPDAELVPFRHGHELAVRREPGVLMGSPGQVRLAVQAAALGVPPRQASRAAGREDCLAVGGEGQGAAHDPQPAGSQPQQGPGRQGVAEAIDFGPCRKGTLLAFRAGQCLGPKGHGDGQDKYQPQGMPETVGHWVCLLNSSTSYSPVK